MQQGQELNTRRLVELNVRYSMLGGRRQLNKNNALPSRIRPECSRFCATRITPWHCCLKVDFTIFAEQGSDQVKVYWQYRIIETINWRQAGEHSSRAEVLEWIW